ncbi:MAG: ACT domain-containing protein [Methanobacteriota archaeon]
MIQLDIELPDRPGELGNLASLLGDAEINIHAISAESGGGRTYMSLIVDQPAGARGLLAKAGYPCTEKTVLVVRLADRPKALAGLAKKLGAAGVNITSVIHLESIGGHAQLALGVDDLAKARTLV